VPRQQVAYAEGRGLSRRRACALLSVARSTLGYVSTLIARDAGVVPLMKTLAAQYPRYGYRTIRIFLERQGHALETDRTIIDEFTRECLAIDVAGGIRSARFIEVLTQLVSVHGAPRYLRSDNGPKFIARAISAGYRARRSRPPSSIRANRGRTAAMNPSTANSAASICPSGGFGIAPRPR
jgi:putative transposase